MSEVTHVMTLGDGTVLFDVNFEHEGLSKPANLRLAMFNDEPVLCERVESALSTEELLNMAWVS